MVDDLFTPQDWLKKATSNYILGTAFDLNNLPENVFLEDLCFELQQCAEKAIKAVLVKYTVDFPKTHDIGDLLKLLKKRTTIIIPENIIQAAKLTKYAVTTRYPHWNKMSKEDYKEAIEITKSTLEWTQNIINSEN